MQNKFKGMYLNGLGEGSLESRGNARSVDSFLVRRMMDEGLPPSRIDKLLGYKPGTAHDCMVQLWKLDKERPLSRAS